jgi:hypothetical protein
MSRATWTFGRFNVPTEEGHGKLVKAVQAHAEKTGGSHYIFPSHSQDAKKNPLEHGQKTGFMRRLFPDANIVSHNKIRTAIDAMKHLEKKGHTHVTMVVGSDRVAEFSSLLNKYRKKEFPGIKSAKVISAGNRDPDAEGAEGMSASKLRDLVRKGKRKEFISHYSDPKLGAQLHDAAKKGMQMESKTPIGIFLLGGPGSGKDYVLNNIFSRFDLTEVQIEHILNGAAKELIESNQNIVINGAIDEEKMAVAKQLLEGYSFDHVFVSVTNKVSRDRNAMRANPLEENKRLEKWYRVEKLTKSLDEVFTFNNSINLNESSDLEKVFFANQIEKLLSRLVEMKLELKEENNPKAFTVIREKEEKPLPKKLRRAPRSGNITAVMDRRQNLRVADKMDEEKKFPAVAKDKESGLPKKYVSGLSASTAKARKAHWKKMGKLSDRDPRAYEPAPGDATAKTKPSKHTLAVRKMMAKEEVVVEKADTSLAAKAEKSGISVSTLRKVYNRGVAAWNSGHRPGTTPQQWGHARVNSYINKGKTYHTADKDLREENDLDVIFERQLVGTDEYRRHAIAMTPGQKQEIDDAFKSLGKPKETVEDSIREERCECGGNCQCKSSSTTVSESGTTISENARKFSDFRKVSEAKKENDGKEDGVDFTPTVSTKKAAKGQLKSPGKNYRSTLDGLPITSKFSGTNEEKKKDFMPTPRQIPAHVPVGTKMLNGVPQHNVPKGFKRVRDNIAGFKLVKEETVTLEEAVNYHLENKISFTENVFRPGSEMFFEMISEAQRLYKEGTYEPKDEWERDMLESNIGEKVMFEGQEVILDYPFEEELNEEDKTEGKGIGKPWREGGGGAVYVRDGGSIRKVRFSQSGMAKKFNDPAATRSFVARHRCLTNKDKTSASYWACRYPRFFSNSGKIWW